MHWVYVRRRGRHWEGLELALRYALAPRKRMKRWPLPCFPQSNTSIHRNNTQTMAIAVLSHNRVACSATVRPASKRGPLRVCAYLPDKEGKAKKETQHEVQKQDDVKQDAVTHRRRREPAAVEHPMRRWADSLTSMQREMDALMGSFDPFSRSMGLFDVLSSDPLPGVVTRGGLGGMGRMVPVEVEETDKEYKVHAEIPGFSKEEVKITLDGTHGILTITGNKSSTEGTPEGGQGTFRSAMSFKRTLSVPQDADVNQPITAKSEHGVLTLVLPKGQHRSHIKEISVE